MIIKQNSSKINPHSILYSHSIQKIYQEQIDAIDLDNLDGHKWHIHGYYQRFVSFLGERFYVKIRRISTFIDGVKVTHALLLDDFVPFLTLSFHDLLMILTSMAVIFSPSHTSYIIRRFAHLSDLSFTSAALASCRSCTVIFMTT